MNSIIKAAAESLHLQPEDLKGRGRCQDISLARYVAMYVILQGNSCTFTEVGKVFNRSPALVSYAYQKIARRLTTDPLLREHILEVERRGKGRNDGVK